MIVLRPIYPNGTIVESGGETFDVVAGKSLKIETSPGGETYLDATVPAGEKWTVSMSVQVKVEPI